MSRNQPGKARFVSCIERIPHSVGSQKNHTLISQGVGMQNLYLLAGSKLQQKLQLAAFAFCDAGAIPKAQEHKMLVRMPMARGWQ